jgi:hypothetical protein
MTHPAVPSTTLVTFVVRFYRETSAGGVRWRGRIEHVQSGAGVSFLDLDGMLAFMHQFDVPAGDEPAADGGKP